MFLTRLTPLAILCLSLTVFTSCEDDDVAQVTPNIDVPDTYAFERDGASTVSFSGQSTRIAMATELTAALLDPQISEEALDNQFRNEEGTNPFSDPELDNSGKSLRSKTAASTELFATNSVAATDIKARFDDWIATQANEVFPAWNELAAPGEAGQLADGSSVRYVAENGLEYNQVFAKSLIGALMYDQIANNYLSPLVLDAGTNRDDNNAGVVADGKPYTEMEHKWDEAYGYLFGASSTPATPLDDLGTADNFLNKYLGRVEGDSDYTGIAADIEAAFRRGRAAIVAGDYELRDEQAAIITSELRKVLAVRAVYYLMQGKTALETTPVDYGDAFHSLSEGYGFVFSLAFTASADDYDDYASRINARLAELDEGQGLWEVTPATLEQIASEISTEFNLDIAAAAN